VPSQRKPKPRAPRGSDYTETDGELTLRGRENAEELPSEALIVERDQTQRHNVQNRALLGLMMLLVEVLLLGSLAMTGVAAGWFPGDFALQLLAITLGSSFTAWAIVLRWAFHRGGRA
jgi:hypothetical protein